MSMTSIANSLFRQAAAIVGGGTTFYTIVGMTDTPTLACGAGLAVWGLVADPISRAYALEKTTLLTSRAVRESRNLIARSVTAFNALRPTPTRQSAPLLQKLGRR